MNPSDWIDCLRRAEFESCRHWLPDATTSRPLRVLEIGAGTGQQARCLQRLGYDVIAIDMADSPYAGNRVFPVTDYDGKEIPLPDGTIDCVFTSNLLEHVSDLHSLFAEISRVLKPGGTCIHFLPTSTWRTWSSISHYPWLVKRAFQLALGTPRKARVSRRDDIATEPRPWWTMLSPRPHGVRGNVLTETWYFSSHWWRQTFAKADFELIALTPARLFYTGSALVGPSIGTTARRRAARILGSACNIYVLQMKEIGEQGPCAG